MAEDYRPSSLFNVDRPGNEELCALMADALAHDTAASLQLIATVTPLLLAFFEGQQQAGRIEHESVGDLVREAFITLHRRRAEYDSHTPFRAWLIEMARCTLLEHLHSLQEKDIASPASAPNRRQVLQAI
ncbi:hypothetical protein HNO86_27405 [Pseudomonas sp. C1C7]|uniref:sigma factor n=1 Tax=Pseudomonas sp. C1C7 TaxID=2735272 RepID=UPI001586A880|nr:sigma factor [Pseudomonas sp. C1C7]NUT78773.1 hypothetical protein [Pseudomonas sp. C1C7]